MNQTNDKSQNRDVSPNQKKEIMPSILIIDDDTGVRKQLYWELTERFVVHQAGCPEEAKRMLKKHMVDIALIDLHMPPDVSTPETGLSVLADICRDYPNIVPIIMTGDPVESVTLNAIDRGAWDVFIKPINPEELTVVLHRAVRLRSLLYENEILKLHSLKSSDHHIIGDSPTINALLETVGQVAPTDATIYITGESGTGKELVAQAIYRQSNRADKPFVAVNCAALSDSLIEDELFGHEAGAYTGSKGARKGKFELADKGTLFLDEVAELSPSAQAKLLRILQEGTFERLGSERVYRVDVRVIVATHQDLSEKVEQGQFREDLYYRLNVIPVKVPPLRERRSDIPLLANYFLTFFRKKMNRGPHAFSPEALQALQQCNWKGNVRELRNLTERLVILVNTKIVQIQNLPAEYRNAELDSSNLATISLNGDSEKHTDNYEEAVNAFRRKYIKNALDSYGNKTEAAQAIGVNRSYLYELIEKLDIQ